MKFIQVTLRASTQTGIGPIGEMKINGDHITTIERSEFGSTIIKFLDGNTITVMESPDEILDLIGR